MSNLSALAKFALALAFGLIAQTAAHAQLTWTWSFSSTGTGNPDDFVGTGTLITSSTPDTNGQYQVTSISGTWSVNSVSSAVSGLADFDGSDNLITLTTPQVDMPGLGFTAGGINYDIYNLGGPDQIDAQDASDPLHGTVTTESGVFSAEISAVPEPSTYALIFGASALGFALYRRRQAKGAA